MNILFPTVVRLFFSLVILISPFWGVVISALIDGFDVYLHDFPGIANFPNYQYWDKTLDTFYLTMAFITSLYWKNKTARNLSLFFYSIRVIGVFLFTFTLSRCWLFFFPNIFEYYFLSYLGYRGLFKKEPLKSKGFFGLFLILVILKLSQEFILHYEKFEFWKWFK